MGATSQSILWQFFVEGLCLLAIVTLPALLIEMQFVYAGMIDTLGQDEVNPIYLPDRTLLRFFLTNCITWVVLACIILMAIWIPARRASRMVPAEALHYE
ncbi:MAG: FtsX-like permease family protein [Parabacteroides sp.]|nr:FtsX-like permease family protein [Parabacteroides sp.]